MKANPVGSFTSIFVTSFFMAMLIGCQAGGPAPFVENTPSTSVQSPDQYKVKLVTTKGDIVLEINREWSPNGADRFYELASTGYFKDIVIFRAVPGFMFQFGIHGDPAISKKWVSKTILDDPGKQGISNQKGFITFAKTNAKNSRAVQFFVNLRDNSSLDKDGFTPFGKVVQGMDVVDKINTEYGENQPSDQAMFQSNGNKFMLGKYPRLDIIKSAEVVK